MGSSEATAIVESAGPCRRSYHTCANVRRQLTCRSARASLVHPEATLYVRPMGEAMQVIREYINEMEALIARSILEAHEIPAIVIRDDAGGMLPSMHLLWPVRLAVRTADVAEALRILDAPFDEDGIFVDDQEDDRTSRP
jgi:hypothetical protein